MRNKIVSPEIVSIKWGSVSTGDGSRYKDAILFPGGSRAWDWNETGTRHIPGIQPADVQELLENEADIVVLSQGINERLQVSSEAIEYLERREIPYYILQTEKAVGVYNRLRVEKRVGALIHSTC